MRKVYRFLAGVCCTSVMLIMLVALYLQFTLPNQFSVATGEELKIISPFNIKIENNVPNRNSRISACVASEDSYKANLTLMGLVDIKQVGVDVVDRKMVVPCGTPFGIKMFTDGVIVVGTGNVSSSGQTRNPATQSGIMVGDIIEEIDGNKVYTNKDVSETIKNSDGDVVKIKVKRGEERFECMLSPVLSQQDNSYKAGIWVRDSSAGIGTMTFYNPSTGAFAGLGHAICDIDTGEVMPLYKGQIVRASVTGVTPGRCGSPGELKGIFVKEQPMGELAINSKTGVYGVLYDAPVIAQSVPIAYKHEVVRGPACIYTTIDGEKPKCYNIVIDEINYSDNNPTKNMVIRITDKELLDKTGGIVQGMSGSPIIQNGFLAGAVTHVFVNDPTSGYAIFAENMEKSTARISSKVEQRAS